MDVLPVAAEQQLKAAGVRGDPPLLTRVPALLAHSKDSQERVRRVLEQLRRYLLAVLRLLHVTEAKWRSERGSGEHFVVGFIQNRVKHSKTIKTKIGT